MKPIRWANEDRATGPKAYIDVKNANSNRCEVFLKGWRNYLETKNNVGLPKVHWQGLGMVYASILGNIGEDERRKIYKLLLDQFLNTNSAIEWTESQKQTALRQAI